MNKLIYTVNITFTNGIEESFESEDSAVAINSLLVNWFEYGAGRVSIEREMREVSESTKPSNPREQKVINVEDLKSKTDR